MTDRLNVLRFVRSPWITKALLLSIIALLCAGAYWFGTTLTQSGNLNGGLVVEPSRLDLGDVWEDSHFSWSLPLRNPTDHTIEVTRFRTSCACAGITPSSIVLAPGEATDMQLTLDLTKTSQKEPESARREFRVQITPQLKGGMVTETGWSLTGKVRRQFVFSPPFLDFEESLIRGQAFQSRSTLVTCASRVTELTVPGDLSLAIVRVKRVGADPDKFDLSVQLRESAVQPGPFSFAITINAVTLDRVPIQGTAHVQDILLDDVCAVPDLIPLGAQPLGQICEDTVLLQSRTGKGFTVTGLENNCPDLSITPLPVSPKGTHSFRVSCRIAKLGNQHARVRFLVRSDCDQSPHELALPVSYLGIRKKQPPGNSTDPARY